MSARDEQAHVMTFGTTRFIVEPDLDRDGSYVFRSTDNTAISTSFTPDNARQFARQLTSWARQVEERRRSQ